MLASTERVIVSDAADCRIGFAGGVAIGVAVVIGVAVGVGVAVVVGVTVGFEATFQLAKSFNIMVVSD